MEPACAVAIAKSGGPANPVLLDEGEEAFTSSIPAAELAVGDIIAHIVRTMIMNALCSRAGPLPLRLLVAEKDFNILTEVVGRADEARDPTGAEKMRRARRQSRRRDCSRPAGKPVGRLAGLPR